MDERLTGSEMSEIAKKFDRSVNDHSINGVAKSLLVVLTSNFDGDLPSLEKVDQCFELAEYFVEEANRRKKSREEADNGT